MGRIEAGEGVLVSVPRFLAFATFSSNPELEAATSALHTSLHISLHQRYCTPP
jgi:hypothetical protein